MSECIECGKPVPEDIAVCVPCYRKYRKEQREKEAEGHE